MAPGIPNCIKGKNKMFLSLIQRFRKIVLHQCKIYLSGLQNYFLLIIGRKFCIWTLQCLGNQTICRNPEQWVVVSRFPEPHYSLYCLFVFRLPPLCNQSQGLSMNSSRESQTRHSSSPWQGSGRRRVDDKLPTLGRVETLRCCSDLEVNLRK